MKLQTLTEEDRMFSLHFIVNGKIDKQQAVFYSRLFNDRMSSDYDDFVQYDREMIAVLRPQAERFIVVIEAEITK